MNSAARDHHNEPKHHSCRHLGLSSDQKTISSYPSTFNYCHYCQPKTIPSLLHQQDYCLSQRHVDCQIYAGLPDAKMPGYIKHKKTPFTLSSLPRYGVIALVIFSLVIVGIFSGFFEALARPTSTNMETASAAEARIDQLIVITQPTRQSISNITIPTAIIRESIAASPTITHTPLPTFTPTPTIALTPTITPTPTCSTPIPLYAMSYLGETYLLSFKLPIDLGPYLVTDQFGYLTLALDLPDFNLTQNGVEITNYDIFLRDIDTTDLLFIDILTTPGRVIEFEFTAQGTRYCSMPIVIARPDQISASTPTLAP